MGEKFDKEDEEYFDGDAEDNGNGDDSQYLINIEDVLNKSEDCPLAEFFLETRKQAKKRSVMSWLATCDDDTIALVCQYGRKIREEITMEREDADDNRGDDVFDNRDDFENEKHYIPSNEEDFYSLVLLVLAWENNLDYVNRKCVPEASFILNLYANVERLIRKGIVESHGCGTLLSKKTEYKLTNKGKKLNKKQLEEVLKCLTIGGPEDQEQQ